MFANDQHPIEVIAATRPTGSSPRQPTRPKPTRRRSGSGNLRTWRVGMATHGSFSGPTEDVDVLSRALKPLEQARFDQARNERNAPRETYHARCFDALIDLARHEGSGTARAPVARVRVDFSALLAGNTSPGEICEIPGVGPVPVDHARTVLSHGPLELVITHGLVRHQTLAFAEHRLTTHELVGSICRDHHDKVTHRGHTIIDHNDGSWTLRPAAQHGEARHTDAA